MDFNTTNKKALLFLIIGLLAALNVFLFLNTKNATNAKIAMNKEKIEVQNERDNLRIVYDQAKSSIQKFKGQNAELTKLSNDRKASIDKMKLEIDNLLKNKDLSAAELKQAQILIKNMKLQTKNYVAELGQLKKENEKLLSSNIELNENLNIEKATTVKLTNEKVVLTEEKEELILETNLLTEIKEKLTGEKTKLIKENETLTTLAELITADNIEVFGIKDKNSGKEKETKKTKKIDRLKVCYDLLSNPVAKSGEKEIFIRLQHPDGYTLTVDEVANESFTEYGTNENKQFSVSASLDYLNDKTEKFCTYYTYDGPLVKGTHVAELYQNGVLIGASDFTLK